MVPNLLVLVTILLPLVRSARFEPVADVERAGSQVEEQAGSNEEGLPSSWLQNYEAEAERRLQKNPLVPFPDQLTSAYRWDKYLGAGSFGESWLVTSLDSSSPMYNEQVVVKLLYLKQSKYSRFPVHLTWRMALEDVWSEKGAIEAARECEIAADLHEQGERSGESGAARVMNCFGHNVPSRGQDVSRRLDMPLFLVLENCGGEDLTKFMKRKATEKALSVELVGGIFKQILEGLKFLASLSEPWVHHDLKPDNVVVKSHRDGRHSAYLIDLGASVKATQAFMCKFTACTPIYAPVEWGTFLDYTCPQLNFAWSKSCPHCGTAFDMFSASAMLVEMVTGNRFCQLSGVWDDPGKGFKYGVVEAYSRNPESIDTAHISPGGIDNGATYGAYKSLMAGFLQPGSRSASFFAEAMKALRKDASRRPTAAKLLEHEFFVRTTIPLSRQPTRIIPKCPFKKGEAVMIFHTKVQDYVRGVVLDVKGLKVEAQVVELVQILNAAPGKLAPMISLYTYDCHSNAVRKFQSQPKEPSAPQSGYRPALGRKQPGFDEVRRPSGPSGDHSCPSMCSQCSTYSSLASTQFVCWSPTALNTPLAAKWLYDHNCETTNSYSKTSFGRPYFGYICSKR